MSRSTVSIRCSLCFTKDEHNGDNLIWRDSLQLCQNCYDRFIVSAYNQRVSMINAIKCYRRLISKYEDNGSIQLDCNFAGIFGKENDKNLKNKENEEKMSNED